MLRLAYDVAVLVIGSLLVAWGLWLLVTNPDGGRPVGALALMVGALGVLVAVLGLRRHRRRRGL